MWHQIIVAGNVGKEPEMRYTPSGQAVTNFSLAANESYTNKNGEQIKRTVWFRISTWGKTAEICNQYIKKGSKVLIEGKLNPDPETGSPKVWESNGKHGAAYEITAKTVRFLSSRGESSTEQELDGSALTAEDDMPF